MRNERTSPFHGAGHRRQARYPRLLAPFFALYLLALIAPSPLSADEAWDRYEDGRQAYAEGRFDKALTYWQEAIASRRDRFSQASAWIDAVLALPEAQATWDSIDTLVGRLAVKEFGQREYAALRAEAAGSQRREMEALHRLTISPEFANFTSAWLEVEALRGRESFGDSLGALKKTAEELQSYPEAEFGLGRVFFVEGELGLAESQFKRALDESSSLQVPETRFEILDALTELYRSKADWKAYEAELRLSLADSSLYQSSNDFLRTAMERALDLEGFDTLVRLYPVDDTRIARPARALGEFLLRNGRPAAVINLAVAADALVSRALEGLRRNDPSIAYTTLVDFANQAAKNTEVADYCETNGLWSCLYYLGEALLADSRLDSGRSLLRSLAAVKGAGPWSKAATMALARPQGVKPASLP